MKPTYRMSKRQIWLSFWLAWAVILYLVWRGANGSDQAVSLAGIVVPSMMFLIAALLGIHRFAGSMDFAAVQTSVSPVQSSQSSLGLDARDDPNGLPGETP